jgi:photosystem II biogenesis protein Psp29
MNSLTLPVKDIRTVSDTKRAFYAAHPRPINSIYRRVIEELMVEMHLLSVNVDFQYDPLYALGIVTVFDKFMQGYRPERDIDSIFQALCQSVGGEAATYRQAAEQLRSEASMMSPEAFSNQIPNLSGASGEGVMGQLRAIADRDTFKYSRLFGVGLLTVLEHMNPEIVKSNETLETYLKPTAEALKLPAEKLQKDLEVYRSNLDKFAQAQAVMTDIMKAERKRKEQRQKEKEAAGEPVDSKPAPTDSSPESSSQSQ